MAVDRGSATTQQQRQQHSTGSVNFTRPYKVCFFASFRSCSQQRNYQKYERISNLMLEACNKILWKRFLKGWKHTVSSI